MERVYKTNILVTAGEGYIGSHICVELLNNNHKVIIQDNLFNSKIEPIDKIKQVTNKEVSFYKIDVTDEEVLESIFVNNKIDGVIHFAGLKAVGESVEKPLAYYYNNLVSTMVLCKICNKYNVNKAEKKLKWKAKRDILDMCKDYWNFEKKYKN